VRFYCTICGDEMAENFCPVCGELICKKCLQEHECKGDEDADQ